MSNHIRHTALAIVTALDRDPQEQTGGVEDGRAMPLLRSAPHPRADDGCRRLVKYFL